MTLVWTRALGKTAVIPYGPSKCSQHWSGHRVLCIPHDSERPCCSGYVWPTEDCVCHLHILPRRKRFVPKTLPSAIKPAWHSDRRNAITTNACIAPPMVAASVAFPSIFFWFGIYIHVKGKKYLLASRSMRGGQSVHLCFYFCPY